MWKKIRDSLDEGIEKIKWFSALLNERLKVEISLIKLIYRSSEIEKRRDAILKAIGERVVELRDKSERNILRDPSIIELTGQLKIVEKEMEEIRDKVLELSKVEI
jgi:hypothetical protein